MKNVTCGLAWVFAAAIAASACNEQPAYQDNPTPAAESQPAGTSGTTASVRLADIAGDPGKYAGQTVTVVADVEEVLGPGAFKLDEDAAVAGGVDNDLLVLSKKAGTLADIDDQWTNNRVSVTGKVGKFTVVEVEREIGWDLAPELEAEVERVGAVLIATSLERMPK